MADEVIAILAIVIGMAAAVLGAVIAQWLLSGQAQRREEQARLEREAAVQVLEEAVRKQVSQEIKEGIEEFAQAMEEHRLKEVIKTIEIATLSRTVLIEELRLDALKRALLEASADNPEIGQLLESSASSPTLGKLMEGLEVPAPRPGRAAGRQAIAARTRSRAAHRQRTRGRRPRGGRKGR
ncbi:MAG: hypothetical protein M5R40_10820 [Anaerolineae bacterium]|nr:hypothetical protein [Anaerolineae bacterium]